MGTKTSKDEAIIEALASGSSFRNAATIAGVGTSTVTRRMTNDDFRAKVATRRSQILEESVGRLTGATRAAVSTLRKLLKSESDAVKLGAAKEILSAVISLRTITDFESRILELERKRK